MEEECPKGAVVTHALDRGAYFYLLQSVLLPIWPDPNGSHKAGDTGWYSLQIPSLKEERRRVEKVYAAANRACPLHGGKSHSPFYNMQSLIHTSLTVLSPFNFCLIFLIVPPPTPTKPIFLQFLQHTTGTLLPDGLYIGILLHSMFCLKYIPMAYSLTNFRAVF